MTVEVELVSSWQAVHHLIDEEEGIYGNQASHERDPGKRTARLAGLLRSARRRAAEVEGRGTRQPAANAVRTVARRVVEAERAGGAILTDPGCRWSAVRDIVGGQAGAAAARRGSSAGDHELFRCIDTAFFGGGREAWPGPPPEDGADAHVHLGALRPWEAQWAAIAGRTRPPSDLAANAWLWRYLDGEHAATLVEKAIALRERLIKHLGFEGVPASDPTLDMRLVRRFRHFDQSGPAELTRAARDYVLLRSALRREMLSPPLRGLDDFSGRQRKIFRSAGRVWLGPAGRRRWPMGAVRRSVEGRKRNYCEGIRIYRHVHGCGRYSVRMNVTPDICEWQLYTVLAGVVRAIKRAQLELDGDAGANVVFCFSRSNIRRDAGDPPLEVVLRAWLERILRVLDALGIPRTQAGLDVIGRERDVSAEEWNAVVEAFFAAYRDPGIGVGITFHAGEDFVDPLDGLARVERIVREAERVRRTSLPVRIGHASVLGVDPYALRWKRFDASSRARRSSLEWAIDALDSFHGPAAGREALARAHKDLRDTGSVPVQPSQAERQSFWRLQEWIAGRARKAGIVIESNPTSNLRILGLQTFDEVPFWGLVAQQLCIALGTDDPDTFDTTIHEEYERLAAAFEKRLGLERKNRIPRHLCVGRRSWAEIESRLRDDTRTHALCGAALTPARGGTTRG